MKTTLSVIGSCRVFTPINRLARRGITHTAHGGAEWYTHSTRDVLQKIKIVRNQLIPSEADVPMIVETYPQKWQPSNHHPDFFKGTDVFIVEICSRKIFSKNGIYFQQWCAQGALNNQGNDATATSQTESMITRVQAQIEVRKDLKLICDRLNKPVIFVGHINTKMTDGNPFPERVIIHNLLRDFCNEDARATFFDPTVYIKEFGEEVALVDSGHYRPEFNDVIGDRLWECARSILGKSDITDRTTTASATMNSQEFRSPIAVAS